MISQGYIVLLLVCICNITLNSQPSFENVSSWAYQLQNINPDEIAANTTFELIVIDYSNDGSDENKFTPEEIDKIKSSGKFVLSYISIGEAEDYRYYWNDSWDANGDGIPDAVAPEWLGPENPNWEGNYKVKYWDPDWQQIINDYVDTIVAQGFDGIYCDIIDAYYYWSEENPVQPDAARLMIEFLSNIRSHVGNENFLIFPQNGEFVAYEDRVSESDRELFFQTISAIGVEDVFCPGDLDENNPFSPDNDRLEVLNDYLSQGKKVFSVEYLTDESIKQQFLTAASDNDFVPYITNRDLGTLSEGTLTDTNDKIPNIVFSFELLQNYPNPFNPTTTIKYSIPVNSRQYAVGSRKKTDDGKQNSENRMYNQSFNQPIIQSRNGGLLSVKLVVYNILGREIATLVNEHQRPGNYEVQWDAAGHTSGIYFYSITAGDLKHSRKMVLLR